MTLQQRPPTVAKTFIHPVTLATNPGMAVSKRVNVFKDKVFDMSDISGFYGVVLPHSPLLS
jgi:hypothetical protein